MRQRFYMTLVGRPEEQVRRLLVVLRLERNLSHPPPLPFVDELCADSVDLVPTVDLCARSVLDRIAGSRREDQTVQRHCDAQYLPHQVGGANRVTPGCAGVPG